MVRAYVGTRKIPTGSGKTLSMMYDIRKFLLNKGKVKYHIVSNTEFTLKEKVLHVTKFKNEEIYFRAEVIKDKVEFFNALATRTHTIFMADEMSIWADQYEWKDVPKVFYTRIKQLRKADIHLLYTVQSFNLVAPRLRGFTNVVIECNPFPKPDIESFVPPPSPIWIRQYWRHPEYFDNLSEIIKNPKLEDEFTYKKKTIFLSELKRTFPVFDTYEITE